MNQNTEFKSQDKSLKKQMIIDTAVKVFHRKGYRTATLDDVANELGLTKPALYHYVSSKENLLSLIYLQALESFFDTIYEIAKSMDDILRTGKLDNVEEMLNNLRSEYETIKLAFLEKREE